MSEDEWWKQYQEGKNKLEELKKIDFKKLWNKEKREEELWGKKKELEKALLKMADALRKHPDFSKSLILGHFIDEEYFVTLTGEGDNWNEKEIKLRLADHHETLKAARNRYCTSSPVQIFMKGAAGISTVLGIIKTYKSLTDPEEISISMIGGANDLTYGLILMALGLVTFFAVRKRL